MPVDGPKIKIKSYKNVKEWRPYIKFETNNTIWTNTKPLIGEYFLCNILIELMRLFGNACIANF